MTSTLTIRDIMSRDIVTLSVDMTLREALEQDAAYLLDQEIHRALVLDGETLVGLVTTTDFLRAIAGRIRESAAA